MVTKLRGAAGTGLERSCEATASGWLRSRELWGGVQLLQAWFAGHGFDRHRHDTYAIGLTDVGVQAFDYRGVTEVSRSEEHTSELQSQSNLVCRLLLEKKKKKLLIPYAHSPIPPNPPITSRACSSA